MMTVTKANEKLTELQIEMVKLVNEYEESTGLVITSVHVSTQDYIKMFPECSRVVATIELPRQTTAKEEDDND